MEMTKGRVSELENRSIKILHAKQQRERRLKKNQDLQEDTKSSDICVIEDQGGERMLC